MADLRQQLDRIRAHAQMLFGALMLGGVRGERTRVTEPQLTAAVEPCRHLTDSLTALQQACTGMDDPSEDMVALAKRADEIKTQLQFLMSANDPDFVYFLELRGKGVFLRASPIDVSAIVRELLIERAAGTILTSATLTVDRTFDYVRGRLGIADAHELRLPSEFDFTQQAVLFLPRQMPDPRSDRFATAMARELQSLLRVTEGRAFVLFTSYANLREVHRVLASAVPYPLLVQGSAPRTVLLREFRSTPCAVLLATSSFWQGSTLLAMR